MDSQGVANEKITRRKFFKGSAGAAAGAVSASLLPVHGETKYASQSRPESDFEKAPTPIPDSNIKETVTVEIVVVGAGVGGD